MNDELDRLAAEAAFVESSDLAAQPPMPGEELPPATDPAQEWRDLAQWSREIIVAPVPELQPDFTPDRFNALGDALHRCAEHYGFAVPDVVSHPLVHLAIAIFPLAAAVVRLKKKNEAAAKKVPSAPAAATVPGSDTVTFGAPIPA